MTGPYFVYDTNHNLSSGDDLIGPGMYSYVNEHGGYIKDMSTGEIIYSQPEPEEHDDE